MSFWAHLPAVHVPFILISILKKVRLELTDHCADSVTERNTQVTGNNAEGFGDRMNTEAHKGRLELVMGLPQVDCL